MTAGVRIQTPPDQKEKQSEPARPNAGQTSVRSRWVWSTFIELVVDGEIVDLNRIRLPEDTPIIDLRFEHENDQPAKQGG